MGKCAYKPIVAPGPDADARRLAMIAVGEVWLAHQDPPDS
jgi:hypothetical protein